MAKKKRGKKSKRSKKKRCLKAGKRCKKKKRSCCGGLKCLPPKISAGGTYRCRKILKKGKSCKTASSSSMCGKRLLCCRGKCRSNVNGREGDVCGGIGCPKCAQGFVCKKKRCRARKKCAKRGKLCGVDKQIACCDRKLRCAGDTNVNYCLEIIGRGASCKRKSRFKLCDPKQKLFCCGGTCRGKYSGRAGDSCGYFGCKCAKGYTCRLGKCRKKKGKK